MVSHTCSRDDQFLTYTENPEIVRYSIRASPRSQTELCLREEFKIYKA
jgi:hypothetical protein